ncbi:hypothetical protein GWI33_018978 [Rhynchophorus ferrugineus]|uniref:Neurite outgrowth-associated protein n=1 Tax=Rhynchophorus ferrugineus TaxID=354439 RepID=A0A834M0Y5_RHYFE|nr:hypothetical protein GWI33_018978 [Rhynchophorus ferrugineus]
MFVLRRFYGRHSPSRKYIKPSKKDPGISKQAKVLNECPEDIDFNELESDFMNVHLSHKEHVEQMKQWHEKEKYLIVKQKYFKEKFPNFLTWHDKEQIRYLHNSDPEEWSIDKLSDGFPALPEIIEKIVKGKWTKKNKQKIENHDKTVIQNWYNFKQGKLNNIPDELKVHLKKFSDRTLNLKPFEANESTMQIVDNYRKEEKSGDFFEIIASYERLKNMNQKHENSQEQIESESNNQVDHFQLTETSNKFNRRSKGLITFKQLQNNITSAAAKGYEISPQDELILKNAKLSSIEGSNQIEIQPEEISAIAERKHQTNHNKVGFVKKTARDMSHLIYPEKITIPEKYYKKGHTYKLNDCYYDSDGEFLYRVPGMY